MLATAEVDERARSVVAMGPGGASEPKPGVLALTLSFDRSGRHVPTLYLAAENDVPIPLTGVRELFQRTPPPKRLFVLRHADHQHFVDDVEGAHEAVRTSEFPPAAAWIRAAMLPISELCSGADAHLSAQRVRKVGGDWQHSRVGIELENDVHIVAGLHPRAFAVLRADPAEELVAHPGDSSPIRATVLR